MPHQSIYHESLRFNDHQLFMDAVPLHQIAVEVGTPTYVYSLKRLLHNYDTLQDAFGDYECDIHFSAKANNNLTLLRTLIQHGAGVDTVSAGEIYCALQAGAKPEDIVFAGVGKTPAELRYAVEQNIGWVNIENTLEAHLLNEIAGELGKTMRVAVRYNPEVEANTHKHIATGHGGAKFGLTAHAVRDLWDRRAQLPHLSFEAIHIHIGSQLGDTLATQKAVHYVLELIRDYPFIQTINIGGGFPVAYKDGVDLPSPADFARDLVALKPYHIILEPGRSIVADAGILLSQVTYIKQHGGNQFLILDTGMTELIRPALYSAHHEIVPLTKTPAPVEAYTVVGPICETTDVLSQECLLPTQQAGDYLALLTAGAYGRVMMSRYNARLNPAEVAIGLEGQSWSVVRRRDTFEDLLRSEI